MDIIPHIIAHSGKEDTGNMAGEDTEPENEEAVPPSQDPPPKDDKSESAVDAESPAESSESPLELDGPSKEAVEAAETARRAAEAKAIAEATASADSAYVPSPSLLTSPSPLPLMRQVDGPSLKAFSGKESVYQAKNVPVPLRGRLDVPIHIGSGGSVVEYSVETNNYDIAFGITAEREEGVTIVTESSRVNCHKKPISGKFLVGSVPCAIVFSFDNEYSWFREKQVTYKITVTPPSQDNVVAGRRRRAKAALKAVSDDRTSAETRFTKASMQRSTLSAEIARMEKELEEKKKSLDVAVKEEGWLKDRLKLRKTQEEMLQKRLKDGWEDEKEAGAQAGDDESTDANNS